MPSFPEFVFQCSQLKFWVFTGLGFQLLPFWYNETPNTSAYLLSPSATTFCLSSHPLVLLSLVITKYFKYQCQSKYWAHFFVVPFPLRPWPTSLAARIAMNYSFLSSPPCGTAENPDPILSVSASSLTNQRMPQGETAKNVGLFSKHFSSLQNLGFLNPGCPGCFWCPWIAPFIFYSFLNVFLESFALI